MWRSSSTATFLGRFSGNRRLRAVLRTMKCLLLNTIVIVASAFGVVAGCGKAVGEPCETKGSGFTASHSCKTKCIDRWGVRCPSDQIVRPGVCAGESECEVGQCPAGQACYHFDDPIEDRSYCLPSDVCGSLESSALEQWERDAEATAAASRAAWKKKFNRNSRTPTAEPPTPQETQP